MSSPSIPVHQLPARGREPTRIERILRATAVIHNDVHRHDFHELFFFAKGTGEHMIDLELLKINGPCMHLVGPGQVHQLDRSADMEGVVVMFASDTQLGHGHSARSVLFGHARRPVGVELSHERLEEVFGLVGQMEQELARAEGPVADIVEGFLGILLIKCAHWAKDGAALQDGPEQDPVRRFADLLERGFLKDRTVQYYADELAMSADHLNELVKRRLGRTASGIIQDRLLLEARRLLLHADLSIKEVGYALNMKDPAYFSRWFHKAAGTTPAAFREEVREKYKH
jgi:AraC-like DNA-binding protein/mannose-6-phosphate isomerase-like protein (cupin superfamily)